MGDIDVRSVAASAIKDGLQPTFDEIDAPDSWLEWSMVLSGPFKGHVFVGTGQEGLKQDNFVTIMSDEIIVHSNESDRVMIPLADPHSITKAIDAGKVFLRGFFDG